MEHIELGTALQLVADWNKETWRAGMYISEFDQVRRTLEVIKEHFKASETLEGIADWHKRIAMMVQVDHRLFLPGDVFWVGRDSGDGNSVSVYGVNRVNKKREGCFMYRGGYISLDLPDPFKITIPDYLGNSGSILRAKHSVLAARADNHNARDVLLGSRRTGDANPFRTTYYQIMETETQEKVGREIVGELRATTSDIEKDDSGEVMIGACIIEVESFKGGRPVREVIRPSDHAVPWTNVVDLVITVVILAARLDFVFDYEKLYKRLVSW